VGRDVSRGSRSQPGRFAAAARRRATAATCGVALAALAGCATVPKVPVPLDALPPSQLDQARRNLRTFNRIWDLVNRNHFDAKYHGVDWEAAAAEFGPRAAAARDEKELYAILNAMLTPLQDSHTHALTPAQAEERHTHQRARTGFNLLRIEGRWIVSEVVPESPADKAGVKPGWIVVARNGQPLGDVIDFRPKEGDEVSWEFLDEHDRKILLTPKAIKLSTAAQQSERSLPGGFIYLRFDEFDGTDRRWLAKQLHEHATAPGVVLDLRRNPGGETFSLGITIGEFFDHGVDCGTFITRGGARSVKNSWQLGSAHYHGRVVILVDGATASAGEIFSAVLQDHGRATLVGRRTAGAVLASWFYALPDGGELQLSREDYVTPKGRRIEGNGIAPDISVPPRTLADIRAGHDPDLDAALRVLQGK
jgi:carboxyl-terminal processing protease